MNYLYRRIHSNLFMRCFIIFYKKEIKIPALTRQERIRFPNNSEPFTVMFKKTLTIESTPPISKGVTECLVSLRSAVQPYMDCTVDHFPRKTA